MDGAAICFRVVVVPPAFGLKHSARYFVEDVFDGQSRYSHTFSDRGLSSSTGKLVPPIGLYPQLGLSGSTPAKLGEQPDVNTFTIKVPLCVFTSAWFRIPSVFLSCQPPQTFARMCSICMLIVKENHRNA